MRIIALVLRTALRPFGSRLKGSRRTAPVAVQPQPYSAALPGRARWRARGARAHARRAKEFRTRARGRAHDGKERDIAILRFGG